MIDGGLRPNGDQQWSKAGLVAGLAFIALAGLIGVDTARMQVPPTYAKVGPQVFPYLATVALASVGLFFIYEAATRKPTALSPDAAETDWNALAAITLGFLGQVLLIERLGFILSSAILFLAVAWGFGSRRTVRDGLIALVLSGIVYLVFTRLLNLQLPGGPLAGLL
jgi:putative tricarboxylic transport membrane protein